jgi:hypothetical protein
LARFGFVATPSLDIREPWPWLDQKVLQAANSARVCMTCQWFRHGGSPQSIPQLSCALHRGLIAHGEHLTHHCQRWTDGLAAREAWLPEVA